MNKKYILIISAAIILIAGSVYYFFIKQKSPEPIACTMEAKLCPDGSYVSRVPPKCEFAPCPYENLIRVFTPQPDEKISSPLLIKGEARGYWFFEATFPVKLLDENGNVIAEHHAQAKGEWMTKDFVPFEAELIFDALKTKKGWLVLEKDNPSGLPENTDELRVPIIFDYAKTVNLYYYNSALDRDETGNILCSRKGLVAVGRKIPISKTPIQDTINLLISGQLTNEETNQGITTEYPLEGLKLFEANLRDNGTLILKFDDPKNKTSGGSCRVGILWFQIEATAKQFLGVKEVKFLPEELFQP